MQKQTIEFVVKKADGVVQKVGKSEMLQPKTDLNNLVSVSLLSGDRKPQIRF